ncbi:MAG: hypothetical protein AAGE03_04355 [Pseudomonadota bacterium]
MIGAEGEAYLIYDLAFQLGRFPSELLDRPVEELRGMLAFLAYRKGQKAKG